jgi:aspartyl protease family protein
MDVSSGTRSLLREVLSWGVSAVIMAAALINFDVIKAHITGALGVPPLSEVRAMVGKAGQNAQSDDLSDSGSTVLQAGRGGHFETPARVNGKSIDVLVDTGATVVALTYEDARRAGISLRDRDFTSQTQTANGVARVAPVRLDKVTIGNITVRDVQGVVAEEGKLFKTLLGMSFLSRLKQVEMRSGKLVLKN